MKISLAITTYQRFKMTVESFAQVIDDDRIDDIVILDDASPNDDYVQLRDFFAGNEKIRVIRQATNQGMSRNKACVIGLVKNPFAILLDSDNTISSTYIDALEKIELDEKTIYCPDFARPHFSFKKFSGLIFDYTNIKELVSDDMGNCCMNCCNYVVPVKNYLNVYEHNPEMKATDTIHFNWLWLKKGYGFHIVDGMEYDHLVGPQSGFLEDVHYNMAQSDIMRKKIMELQ